MDRSILKTGIPAAVVASVLGFSMLFPAVASRGIRHGDDKEGYGHKCGYGQIRDQDEKNAGDEKDKRDNDCNEDEDDNAGDGGGGGDRAISATNQLSVQVTVAG